MGIRMRLIALFAMMGVSLVWTVGCASSDPPENVGGMGGDGGSGGAPSTCSTGSDCDDGNDCTDDVCDCDTLACSYTPRPDDALCAEGACRSGACEAIASSFPCTEKGIRDAVAQGGGPHTFDCAGLTTVTTAAEIVIDNDVVLDGLGDLTIDGDDTHRVFFIPADTTVELRRLAVTGARLNGVGNLGDLTMTECAVTDNHAEFNGGGLANQGTLVLERCTISGNSAGDSGGGLANQGNATLIDSIVSANISDTFGGGIISILGTLTVSRSEVVNNLGGGIRNEGNATISDSVISANATAPESDVRIGALVNLGDVHLLRSTVSDNQGNPGGIFNQRTMTLTQTTVSRNATDATPAAGAGITSAEGSVEVLNSTISENITPEVGAGLLIAGGSITLLSSTVADNIALGGFDALASNPGVAITVTNSVIAGECSAPVPDSSDSIESPGDTCALNESVSAEELELGPLADNGGPTQTHALGESSAAINTVAVCFDLGEMPLLLDQRGESRPAGPACDAGSFELGMGGSGGNACIPSEPHIDSVEPVGFVTTEAGATPLRGNTGGGTLATDRCPVGQALTGFSYSVDTSLDGIAVRCSILSLRPIEDGTFEVHTTVPRPTALEGPPRGRLAGEPAGFNCPDGQVLTGFSGDSGFLIDALTLRCTELEVAFDGDYELVFGGSSDFDAITGGGGGGPFPQTDCPAGQLASGADIRAGDAVDAIGFRCSTVELIQ